MPSTRRGRSCPANPAIIPACVDPVTVQTMMVSKKTPSSCSCCCTSYAQLAKPSPPSGCSEAPAGMRVRIAPGRSTSSSACFPRVLDADSESGGGVQPYVCAHDPGEQDVADLVVDDVGPIDPAFLHQAGFHAEPSGDGRHLAGVVGLDSHRSRPGCRRPSPARRERCTRACASCCRRRRAPSCSPRASPRSADRRGDRSGVPAGGRGWGRTAAGIARSRQGT